MVDVAGIVAVVVGGGAAFAFAAFLGTQSDHDVPGYDSSGEIPPPPGGCDEYGNYVDPVEWEAWWRDRNKGKAA